MAIATVIALGIRIFTLTRPGFLTLPSEYDDGIYLGASIRLTQGVLPYHDFAFVQPPGILLLMTPVALLTRVITTSAALGVARVLTALASTACVPLAGNLVRRRGPLATTLACGILAIYPPDIATAHTLLLEPWMNLLCLLGANAAFSGGRLAVRPARLAWAGIAIGFASTVKFWAMAPAAVLLVVCLVVPDPARIRRTLAYLAGLAGAFVIPLAPFVLSGPTTFFRSTVVYQAARTGTYTSLSLRLAHVTGVIDVLSYWGHVALAGANSLFAQSVAADTAPAKPHVLPYVAALMLLAIIVAGYVIGWRDTRQVEWFALGTAACALAAILCYSAFFYHYPAFPGPWLALVTGIALWRLLTRLGALARRLALGLLAIVLAGAAVLQLGEVALVTLPVGMERISSRIPPGTCVLSDEVALLITSDLFESAKPGCPVIIDSLATTLVFTHGTSVQGGADDNVDAVIAWQRIIDRVNYVWFSPNVWKRIPWPDYAWNWFTASFKQIVPKNPNDWIHGYGMLFVRK
jgi:alpha-1,2-mannosyltransferase